MMTPCAATAHTAALPAAPQEPAAPPGDPAAAVAAAAVGPVTAPSSTPGRICPTRPTSLSRGTVSSRPPDPGTGACGSSPTHILLCVINSNDLLSFQVLKLFRRGKVFFPQYVLLSLFFRVIL